MSHSYEMIYTKDSMMVHLNCNSHWVSTTLTVRAQMHVSLVRIENFLDEDEVQVDAVTKEPRGTNSAIAVEIVRGVFSWEASSSTPNLRDISLEVRRGQTVAVCGQVGSGKSTLLCAILGETSKRSGMVSNCPQDCCGVSLIGKLITRPEVNCTT